jgi:signal transduction histidine kinase
MMSSVDRLAQIDARRFGRLLARVPPAHIEIVTLSADDIWSVCVDRGEIKQVMMNLAMNARDAMLSEGRFGIEIENRSLHGRDQDLQRGTQDDKQFRIGIRRY